MPAHQTSSALNAGPDPTTLEPLKSHGVDGRNKSGHDE